ncbi:branched-chain amino acid ABC transporter substrate-binding protein [Acuticoccus sp.]|uniref:branched-chain amino acid ABC transporter substrate-binding protein n=1 Tax=Acuticoccus sp. TaxID=1904378 RepID=UPI003B528B9D
MRKTALASAAALTLFAAPAMAQDTLKIAFIEGMSGPFANVGDQALKHFLFAIDEVNADGGAGGKPIEIIPFDNQTNPKESLIQFQRAVDEGIQYITQGNGSSVASALIDAVDKHNQRNPDEPVLFLNYSAVDPAFTNDRCSFWHFRWDADADMKMAAITDWLAKQDDIKSVYIFGQDYSFGKAVAAAAERMIEEKRPDIEIVGNELHPLGKVKDFSPYVQKIMSSGADAVITGNWGQDMALLIKAAGDAGHEVPYLTYYGGGLGAVTAMGEDAVGLVKQVSETHENADFGADHAAKMDEFEERFAPLDYYFQRIDTLVRMFDKAVDEVGSDDPTQVALALEGMELETPLGTVVMREDNHQVIQPLLISTLSDDVERTIEGTPFGFKTDPDGVIEADATRTETTCEMPNRPNPS